MAELIGNEIDASEADAAIADAQAWLDAHPLDAVDRATWLEQLVDSGWAAPSWPVEDHGRGLAPGAARAADEVFRRAGAAGRL